MLLTIDAGNTRTKWAIFDRNGEITRHGACLNNQLSDIDLNPESLGYERIILSNVAGQAHALKLESILANHHLPITWVSASREACNVRNGYMKAEALGTDRWAALIAAWHIQKAPCVVVNAGTAITIDALSIDMGNHQQGEFLGGMILPGINLMLTSLGQNTAQLPKPDTAQEPDKNISLDIFAKSTTQAINTGVSNAISGAIAQMSKALETKCGQIPYIILGGGDAPVIKSCLINAVKNQSVIIDHLVLKGLYLIDRFQQ
jgi:type III pantothenate kinase